MKRLILVLLAVIMLLTPSCDFMKSINPFGKKKRQTEALQKQQEAYRVADSNSCCQMNRLRQLRRRGRMSSTELRNRQPWSLGNTMSLLAVS